MTDTVATTDNTPAAPAPEGEAAKAPTGEAAPLTVEELAAKYEALKKEASKWETRSKENFEKAKLWSEYEESKKPVEQKTAERLSILENENKELKLAIVKTQIAAKYGFNDSALKRLSGSTAEELEADAKELQALLGSAPAPATKPNVQPVNTQGNINGSSVASGKAKNKAELIAMLTGK